MNAQLEAAHAAVPEIAEFHERKARVEELFRSLPAVDAPEVEAQRVADEAVAEFLDTGAWPSDVEERAQAAYTAAVGAHAVRSRLAAVHREYTGAATLTMLRELNRTEILAALGVQLADLLTDARKHTPALGSVRTADEALTAGGDVAEAYTALRALLPVLKNIRAAQWEALRQGELSGPSSLFQRAKDSGFGDVQGISDETPRGQFTAMQNRRYTLDHLVWLAQMNGVAYVPESVEDVLAAQDAYLTRHSVSAALPVKDFSPTVVVTPPAPQPKPRPVHGLKPAPADIALNIN
ncbi:hypothetical protein ACFW9O_18300 [Streptomyces sp. NPDC059499]|uniref:hypothetical protein n=1 Tax=Streptomyces sp. NPDC059499 TaxID=3346852 RepID=UPI0036BD6C94